MPVRLLSMTRPPITPATNTRQSITRNVVATTRRAANESGEIVQDKHRDRNEANAAQYGGDPGVPQPRIDVGTSEEHHDGEACQNYHGKDRDDRDPGHLGEQL